MSLRVVVYAEGAGELRGAWASPPAPGEALEDDQLGPAHVLARRCIETARRIPVNAIRFEQGLRKRNTAEPRGSDLVHAKTLQLLLDWPLDDMRPELAIVLVDEDDDRTRYRTMQEWIAALHHGRPPSVIAVARQEFESWLVTDRACVAEVLGRPLEEAGDPEEWPPNTAKQLLQRKIDASVGSDMGRVRVLRREICACCDLALLKRSSRSFARFLSDLAQL